MAENGADSSVAALSTSMSGNSSTLTQRSSLLRYDQLMVKDDGKDTGTFCVRGPTNIVSQCSFTKSEAN